MQKSYESGIATHIGPDVMRRSVDRGRAGRVFSRVRLFLRDADAVRRSGRQHLIRRYREACQSPARSDYHSTWKNKILASSSKCGTETNNRLSSGTKSAVFARGAVGVFERRV